MSISMRTARGRRRARMQQWWRDGFLANWQALSRLRIDRANLLARIKSTSLSQLFLVGLLTALGLALIWLVMSSYFAYQASVALNTALDLDAVELAVRSQEVTPKSDPEPSPAPAAALGTAELRDRLRTRSEDALRGDLLNARALRVLGQLASEEGDETRAAALMEAAARHSLHESITVYWLMQNSYQHGDFTKTAYYADALLRTRPQLVGQVTPLLARLAENNDAGDELTKILAANPPWRSQFLSALPNSIADARTPLHLLLNLRDTPTPPTTNDLRSYLNFLIAHKFYDIAYYTWLQFLPPEELTKVGFLFNGNFANKPSGLPFDWVIMRGSGVTVDLVPKPEEPRQRALFIEFGYGRVEFPDVSQMVMLTPGPYRFTGRYKGELVGRRGLVWRITCATGAEIGQSAMLMGTTPSWKDFEFDFTVPEADCRAQYVRLNLDARSASEQFVSGSMWFDDLSVSRLEQTDATLRKQDGKRGSDLRLSR